MCVLLPCPLLLCCVQVTFFMVPKFLDLADDVNNVISDLANKSSGCEGSGDESNKSGIDKLLEDQQRIVNGVKGK